MEVPFPLFFKTTRVWKSQRRLKDLVQRIRVISNINVAIVVAETNKALADGWQHLDQSVIAVHEVSSNIKLVPLYTVWLVKVV